MRISCIGIALLCVLTTRGISHTIAEKMAGYAPHALGVEGTFDGTLKQLDRELASLRAQLALCYEEVDRLHATGAEEQVFSDLLIKTNGIKKQIYSLEMKWREFAVDDFKKEEEGYALWDQEETTLARLVSEYGSLDYLFVVPPDLAAMKLHMHSNVPIPRESWSEMLDIILAHHGIGVKKVNTYVRQLYVLKQDLSAIQAVVASSRELDWVPDHTRLCFVFTPAVEQVRSSLQFFERFADAKQTFVYQVGPKIVLVAVKEEILKLLHLYETVWEHARGKVSRVVSVNKMAVKEMEKILLAFFSETVEKNKPPFGKVESQEGLQVFSLAQGNSVVLIGPEEIVDRAECIIRETEEQLQDPAEMTVYLYHCRHSNPDDLSKVLEKVYNSLLVASTEASKEVDLNFNAQGPLFKNPPDGYPVGSPLAVSPTPLKTGSSLSLEIEQGTDHFISDPKTGNVLMVVRRDALIKIKDLLRKLDVPKKMVQMEVMLFEKRLNSASNYGMNLLKIGSRKNHLGYTSDSAPKGLGVLEFLKSGPKSKRAPAYDVAVSFMMSQEDVQLSAAPSVTTVNQTPAMISIVEEISINNGAAPVDTNKGYAFEKSYSRAQYGIVMKLTPTVHLCDLDDPLGQAKGSVTLKTDIAFDTPRHKYQDDKPLVHRRSIQNEVRVIDGQTVILGGLRRKAMTDQEEKVPFLGDIPGLGKFFGTNNMQSDSSEMFIFITPTLVLDPEEDLNRIRSEEVKKRPGDIPEYLQRVIDAQEKERNRYFRNSFKALLGGHHG